VRIHRHGGTDRPPLLLIHGLSSSHRVWQRNLAALGGEHRLLMVELFRGGRGPFRLDDQADRLAEELAADTAPLDVIGHSLGGLIALELAARHPSLVRRLVLMDVPAVPAAATAGARLAALRRPGVLADARSIGVVVMAVASANPVHLLGATRASLASDLAAQAAAVQCPTLVLWGEFDAIVPLEVGHRLAELIPSARFEVLAGTGHQPQWEAPDAFHAAVRAFLEEG